MKEVEILVEVKDDFENIVEKFKDFKYIGKIKVLDEYYYDPKRNDLKPNKDNHLEKCLRLRTKGDKYYITYKEDIFEKEKWLYSDEYETEIEDVDKLRKILTFLGFKKLLEIDNTKLTYIHENYEIVLEDVAGLGYFLEVEYCSQEDIDVKKVKKEIQTFIDNLSLNVSEELNMGKPELFLRKHNIEIED